jgi:hypothetical protein
MNAEREVKTVSLVHRSALSVSPLGAFFNILPSSWSRSLAHVDRHSSHRRRVRSMRANLNFRPPQTPRTASRVWSPDKRDRRGGWTRSPRGQTDGGIPGRYIHRSAWVNLPSGSSMVYYRGLFGGLATSHAGGGMFREEKTFAFASAWKLNSPSPTTVRPISMPGCRNGRKQLKPELMRLLFDRLRQQPGWQVYIRNRGLSPQDEIEIAMVRDFSPPPNG